MATPSDDLVSGEILTPANLDLLAAKLIRFFAAEPYHAEAFARAPNAAAAMLDAARQELSRASARWHDFDLAYNFHFWLQQFATYGTAGISLVWDSFEQLDYPFLNDAELNRFCLSEGLAYIENAEACIAQFLPLIPALLTALEYSGVRFIANHATWMSQGILIILLFHSLQAYAQQNPGESARLERMGLLDSMQLGQQIYTLLGPWITTTGQRLSAVTDLTALRGVNALGNVIKVFPDTDSGRMPFFPFRWKKEVKRALKRLHSIEATPGKILLETPSARGDEQRNGRLTPYPMARAAVRLARSKSNQLVLVGLDERALFDTGFNEGAFLGGSMQPGRVGVRVKSYLGQRPAGERSAAWPFTDWTDIEPEIAALIHDPDGQRIGQVAPR